MQLLGNISESSICNIARYLQNYNLLKLFIISSHLQVNHVLKPQVEVLFYSFTGIMRSGQIYNPAL